MPEFETLPGWARWLAQDADGTWWAYEAEPHQHHNGWYENEIGQCQRLAKAAANKGWRNTLVRVKSPHG